MIQPQSQQYKGERCRWMLILQSCVFSQCKWAWAYWGQHLKIWPLADELFYKEGNWVGHSEPQYNTVILLVLKLWHKPMVAIPMENHVFCHSPLMGEPSILAQLKAERMASCGAAQPQISCRTGNTPSAQNKTVSYYGKISWSSRLNCVVPGIWYIEYNEPELYLV